ncbi:glycoside hydrolase family 76 protein [Microlunatus sp. Y2014]|uniref:glycoside hydrolase family 76 protein n=1 Tax=Microlunatus sp. Y2014 TaxID=3418488 RepID=UPI003DA797B7
MSDRTRSEPRSVWSARADAAEQALTVRHLRRLFGLPGTELAVVSWPAVWSHRLWLEWHYWWQAHLIDCLVDAQDREPTPQRRRRIVRITRSHRLRNLTGWTNSYFDDMAWLGLALERADRVAGVRHRVGLAQLTDQLVDHWTERRVSDSGVVVRVGGLPWRRGADFFNTPANGPAAILLARTGHLGRAIRMADWLDGVVRDAGSGLVYDGVRVNTLMAREIYSYCQGVVLGVEVELARRVDPELHGVRAARLVQAVAQHLCTAGVITGGSGGDGGLFNGILARYLALVATGLPGSTPTAARARATATSIVLASAEACWHHRAEVAADGSTLLPLFGHDWTSGAVVPTASAAVGGTVNGAIRPATVPERDLSVQLGGWMLLEAAARVSGERVAVGRPAGGAS